MCLIFEDPRSRGNFISVSTRDLSGIEDIIEGGYLDSFELMSLISLLSEGFEVEIGVDEIVPENFNSVAAMVAMVERLQG